MLRRPPWPCNGALACFSHPFIMKLWTVSSGHVTYSSDVYLELHLKEQNLILIIFTEETIANKYLLYGSGIENTGRNVEVCMFKPGPRAESLLLFFFVVVVGGGLVWFLVSFEAGFFCSPDCPQTQRYTYLCLKACATTTGLGSFLIATFKALLGSFLTLLDVGNWNTKSCRYRKEDISTLFQQKKMNAESLLSEDRNINLTKANTGPLWWSQSKGWKLHATQ